MTPNDLTPAELRRIVGTPEFADRLDQAAREWKAGKLNFPRACELLGLPEHYVAVGLVGVLSELSPAPMAFRVKTPGGSSLFCCANAEVLADAIGDTIRDNPGSTFEIFGATPGPSHENEVN